MCVDIIVCAQTVGARAMSIHQSILVLAARNSGARRGRSSARATLVRLQLDPQPITTVKNRRVPAELAAVSSAAASKAAPTPDLRASRPSMRREAPVGPFLPRFAERVRTLSTVYSCTIVQWLCQCLGVCHGANAIPRAPWGGKATRDVRGASGTPWPPRRAR